MRPREIGLFELLFLVSIVIGLAQLLLNFDVQVRRFGAGIAVATSFATPAILVGLMLLVSRLASRVALVLLTLLTAAGVVFAIVQAAPFWTSVAATMGMAALVVQVIAVGFLFTKPARAWFAERAARADAEPASTDD